MTTLRKEGVASTLSDDSKKQQLLDDIEIVLRLQIQSPNDIRKLPNARAQFVRDFQDQVGNATELTRRYGKIQALKQLFSFAQNASRKDIVQALRLKQQQQREKVASQQQPQQPQETVSTRAQDEFIEAFKQAWSGNVSPQVFVQAKNARNKMHRADVIDKNQDAFAQQAQKVVEVLSLLDRQNLGSIDEAIVQAYPDQADEDELEV